MKNSKIKGVSWAFVKLSISIGLSYFATRQIDFQSFRTDLHALRPVWLAVALLQTLLIPALGGARWSLVLKSMGTSFGLLPATKLFWIGMAFNQVLPSVSGGDAVRIILANRGGLALKKSIHSVVLERVAVLFALIALVVFMQLVLWRAPGQFEGARLVPLLLLAAIVGVSALLFADKFIGWLPWWIPLAFLTRLSIDSRAAFLSMSGVKLGCLCLMTHLNFALANVWLGKAFGMTLSLPVCLYFVSIVTLVMTLPVSIGGWGIREATWSILMGSIGVSAHMAVAFSVLSGIGVALVSLSGLPLFWSANLSRLRSSPMGDLIKLSGGKDDRVLNT